MTENVYMDNGKKETPLVVSKGIVTFLQKCSTRQSLGKKKFMLVEIV